MASETSDRGETRIDAESGAHDHAQDMFFASAHHDHSDDLFSAGQPMDAQNQPVQQVPIPANDHVIRVQVTPGEILELAPPFTPDADLAAREANGNLAIKVGDVTVILEGFIDANTTAPVVVETSDGKPIDIATVIAQTDPTIDIQTAAGPAAGPQGQGADNTGAILAQLAGGAGLGGFNAVGGQDGTSLTYGLIDNSIIQDRFLTAGPLGGPGFSITGTMSEPILRDPIHVFAGESFTDFLNDYKSALGGGSGYADYNGTQVGSITTVDDYLAKTTEHIQIPNPTNTGVTFDSADFFSGLSVPTSNGEQLQVNTADNGLTAYLVRPSDGAVIMVFHIDNDGSSGGAIQIEAILLNRIDHPGTSDPSHPTSDSYADTISIDFNTSVPNPESPQEGQETPPTVAGPGGHIDVLDDVPVAHEVHYTSFFGDDNSAPGQGGDALPAALKGDGDPQHQSFTSTDFGSVDEDWLKGNWWQHNQGNQDQDNSPAGANSDPAHGDDLGRTVVTGNLDIDYGADGPAGGGGNDILSLSAPSPEATLVLGLANVPDIGGNFSDADGKQLTSDGHDLVVLDHYVDGKGVEHLIVGYHADDAGAVPDALFSNSSLDVKDTVKVFELSLDVNPNDNDDKGLDFQDFKFELFHGIDQPNDPNGAEPTESNTNLHFDVIGHDDDGDAVHTAINIHVNDDVPTVGETTYVSFKGGTPDVSEEPALNFLAGGIGSGLIKSTDFGMVDEDWLKGGGANDHIAGGAGNQDKDGDGENNAGLNGDDYGKTLVVGALSVNFGGDGPTTQEAALSLKTFDTSDANNLPLFVDADGHSFKSGGHDLVVLSSSEGHIEVGYKDGGNDVHVFSLDLGTQAGSWDFGDFAFQLQGAIDHTGANEQNLVIHFDVTATDADFDTAHAAINIQVNDDVPEASVSYLNTFNDGTPCPPDKGDNFGQVDEDMLATGNHDKDDAGYNSNPFIDNDPVRGDDWGGTTVTGTIGKTIDFGADGEGKNGGSAYALAHLTGNFLDANGNQVTQDGKDLVVLESTDNHLSVGVAGGSPAFELTLNPDGTFTFTLEQALDELPGSGKNPVENDLMLSFLASNPDITDGDGDPATALIRIKINDDAPKAYDDVAAKNTYGGNVLVNDLLGADGATVTAIKADGWSNHAVDQTGADTTVAGKYGDLTIHADGTWSYQADVTASSKGGSHADTFTYTVTDGDGDKDTAHLTVIASGPTHSASDSYGHSQNVTGNFDASASDDTKSWKITDNSGDHSLAGSSHNDFINADGGNDTVHGKSGDDTIFGGAGGDSLFGDAGHDVMSGGGGDDVIHADAEDFSGSNYLDGVHSIDGGNGIDTLDLSAVATFDNAAAGRVENIENLSLTGGAGTTVTLTANSVYGVTEVGGMHVLTISGESSDQVNLQGTAGTWTKDSDTTINGSTYDVYHAIAAGGVGVTVNIEHTVDQHTNV